MKNKKEIVSKCAARFGISRTAFCFFIRELSDIRQHIIQPFLYSNDVLKNMDGLARIS